MVFRYSDLLSPKSDQNSVSNYTEVNNFGSPDRLRILKSTLRHGQKLNLKPIRHKKNLTEALDKSVLDSSMYSSKMRRETEDSSTLASPVKALHPIASTTKKGSPKPLVNLF